MSEWTMPKWMESYREYITNTGGNTVEDLMNDHSSNASNNVMRAGLIVSVESQIVLLHKLYKKGLLLQKTQVLKTGRVSKLLGLAHTSVIKLINDGYLKAFKYPDSTHRRILKDDLVQFVIDHEFPQDIIDACKRA